MLTVLALIAGAIAVTAGPAIARHFGGYGGWHHGGGWYYGGRGPGFGFGWGYLYYYGGPYSYPTEPACEWLTARVWRGHRWVFRRVWRCW